MKDVYNLLPCGGHHSVPANSQPSPYRARLPEEPVHKHGVLLTATDRIFCNIAGRQQRRELLYIGFAFEYANTESSQFCKFSFQDVYIRQRAYQVFAQITLISFLSVGVQNSGYAHAVFSHSW